jgi:hypothetical protein
LDPGKSAVVSLDRMQAVTAPCRFRFAVKVLNCYADEHTMPYHERPKFLSCMPHLRLLHNGVGDYAKHEVAGKALSVLGGMFRPLILPWPARIDVALFSAPSLKNWKSALRVSAALAAWLFTHPRPRAKLTHWRSREARVDRP